MNTKETFGIGMVFLVIGLVLASVAVYYTYQQFSWLDEAYFNEPWDENENMEEDEEKLDYYGERSRDSIILYPAGGGMATIGLVMVLVAMIQKKDRRLVTFQPKQPEV